MKINREETGDAPKTREFECALYELLTKGQENKSSHIDVTSGELHRIVGGYPARSHRMKICCAVMKKAMKKGDVILSSPPKGDGATLIIRYLLPR